jgi:hypothetical protein
MEDEILFQGPGFTIARTLTPGTLVPYERVIRADGNINHGWIDLRGNADRVTEIPEAAKSKGLAELLRVIADPRSKLMSGACECAAFELGPNAGGPQWQVGGFVTVMFGDAKKNVVAQNFIDLAQYILGAIPVAEDVQIGFEFLIEPLKLFFGRTDCYDLMLKPLGYGPDEHTAWAAFNYASNAAAASIGRHLR